MPSNFRKIHVLVILVVLLAWGLGQAAAQSAKVQKPVPQKVEAGHGMSLLQATVLGVVEGLTEYLPVSSTGHLLIAERVVGLGGSASGNPAEKEREKDASDAYTIIIQAGAIVAVLGLYFKQVRRMLMGLLGRDRAGLRLAINIFAAFLPAAIVGLLLHKVIKAYLFGPWPVVAAWFAGGLAILAFSRTSSAPGKSASRGISLDDMNVRMALAIGAAQCIAMWPGVSRSLVTILGGLMAGLSMSAAVEFTFLLGVVTLGAATAFDAMKHGGAMMQVFDLTSISVGLVAAFLSAVVSVKWMVSYLNRHGIEIFGYYRLALAIVVAALILARVL